MTVSFAVQAHPIRTVMAESLADSISGEVVYDPDPGSGFRSPWRTFKRLLEETPAGASHRFQIQDDALPCQGLHDAVEAAVASQPDRLLVFYVGGNPKFHAEAVLRACARDDAWVNLPYAAFVPVVATCWPVSMIGPFLTYVEERGWPERFGADDEIVGRWVRHAGVIPLASVPSLVDHPDVVDSMTRRQPRYGSDPGRVAACWVGDCAECASGIDWTRGPS